MRSEKYTEENVIKRDFNMSNETSAAGPVIYRDSNGNTYIDEACRHVGVIGNTGAGKSESVVLNTIAGILKKGESGIFIDPKGDGYRLTDCLTPKGYQKFVVNFRDIRNSPTKFNPLRVPYLLFRTGDPDAMDTASSMISELFKGIYPVNPSFDPFWPESAANFAQGIAYALMEMTDEEHINLNNVSLMMEQSETKIHGQTAIKALYDMLPNNSLARRNLSTYVNSASETRGSIHSVACSGLEVCSRSRGLMELLAQDTLDILNLDVDKPFVCWVITPDETDVYDAIAGILVSQLTQHLIRVAQDRGGSLPIRCNVILEELGSVGKAIGSLPNLLVASRSRNIRIMTVLQSFSQLDDVYGASKAETIKSCIRDSFCFSTNNWDTLNEWSQRCGDKYVELSGQTVKEPLITPAQLAAMPVGTALVMIDQRYKYITQFPMFSELYDQSKWEPPNNSNATNQDLVDEDFELKDFSFVDFVKGKIREKAERELEKVKERMLNGDNEFVTEDDSEPLTAEYLIHKIDAKIAEIEEEEKRIKEDAKRKKESQEEGYDAEVLYLGDDPEWGIRVIARMLNIPMKVARNVASHLPCKVHLKSAEQLKEFLQEIAKAGGDAIPL